MDSPGAELVGHEQEARAEALDLQGPIGLPVQAVPDAAGREPDEGKKDDRNDACEDGPAEERVPPAVTTPHVCESGRNDDDRKDLRRRREAEHPEAGPLALGEHSAEAEHHQRRWPEIEAGQDHGAESERRQRREAERDEEAFRLCTQGAERNRRADDCEQATQDHQPLEVPPINPRVVPVADCRQQEDRQRRRRVLDREVEVGHLPVDHCVAVPLVNRRVDDLAAPIEAVVKQCPGGAEDGERDQPGRERDPALSRQRPALLRRAHAVPGPRRESHRNGKGHEGDEGEEPGQVEKEPVGQHQLETDQQSCGQRRQLAHRLSSRHEVHADRAGHKQNLQAPLHQMQVRIARAVLLPVPDRERRMATDLELDRPVVEDVRCVERARLEQQDREGDNCCREESAEKDKLLARAAARVRVRGPQRRHEQRRELRPAGECRQSAAGKRRRHQPEAPDQKERRQGIVRIRVRHVLRERPSRPCEDKGHR